MPLGPSPVPAPQVVAVPPLSTNDPTRLRILNWNIWMMPSYLVQSPENKTRAAAIAKDLPALDYDILCFEKAFSSGARKVLARELAAHYPYQYGPANSTCSLKINGGVWILSRIPLTNRHDLQFRDTAGAESFSRKGAMMMTGEFQGHRFHVVAAHLQGESGSQYTEKRQRVREKQYQQLRDELLSQAEPGAPIFICGDFNTPRRDPTNPGQETEAYRGMLQSLGNPQNGVADRPTVEDRCELNDLAMANEGRVAELDYILIRPGAAKLETQWRRITLLHPGWDGRTLRQNLSYRHGVAVDVKFE